MNRLKKSLAATFVLGLFLVALPGAGADPVLGPWVPLFKGIDYLVGTNSTGSADFENLMVAHALRIDLHDPDIRFLGTPRITNYQANVRETAGRTVSQFLRTNHVQAAINAGFFTPPDYYLPEGTAMRASGLLISQGEEVSPANSTYSAVLMLDADNHATIIPTNWPATSTERVWTAVSGDYSVLVGGVNVGRKYRHSGGVHDTNPRTAIGLSQDLRYLFLLTIDGRQPGYSDGAYDYETAGWLLLLGAQDGINMDGGGSTTLVVEDSTGKPLRLNRSSAVADSGRERTVGSHLGVFAKPVPNFISDLAALPDDDTATITWTTGESATSAVEYGPTTELGQATPVQAASVTNHAVLLTGLQPATGYYYRAVSVRDGTDHTSPIQFFTTESYLETNLVVALTDPWKFTTANLDGVNWTDPNYDDSSWSGPGAGLLWVDSRGPNPDIQPKGTELPLDDTTGFPYTTYYFRTHFQSPAQGPGVSLLFSAYLDDGAVIHLNGREILRLRMDDPPAAILNGTLASGYPWDGDATSRDEFGFADDLTHYLNVGDNVLSVEVHNYNARSADITFGADVTLARSVSVPPVLVIAGEDGNTTLSWTRGGFVLQWSEAPVGLWTDVPGPVLTSPFVTADTNPTRYYRLRK